MIGQVVCSKAGRDKGYFMVVVEEKDGFIKTPTQKIKRALYYNRKKGNSQNADEKK